MNGFLSSLSRMRILRGSVLVAPSNRFASSPSLFAAPGGKPVDCENVELDNIAEGDDYYFAPEGNALCRKASSTDRALVTGDYCFANPSGLDASRITPSISRWRTNFRHDVSSRDGHSCRHGFRRQHTLSPSAREIWYCHFV